MGPNSLMVVYVDPLGCSWINDTLRVTVPYDMQDCLTFKKVAVVQDDREGGYGSFVYPSPRLGCFDETQIK